MGLSSRLTTTLAIPDEPGQSVTIRKLSKRALDEAQEAQLRYFMSLKDVVETVQSNMTPDQAQQAAAANPYAAYRPSVVLNHCVTAWTYGDVNEETIDDLEPATADWLFTECMKFSLRSPAEGEGSGPTSDSPSSTDEAGPQN